MAEYNFSQLTLLIVDDSSFMQRLLYMLLRAFRFGQIHSARERGEAIELLRAIGDDPVRAGVMAVDIVLSNWRMTPVDGMELLRWIRHDNASPDRFLPFILVKGYADRWAVTRARDEGATELLAKPYAIASLTSRLLSVINRPRDFILTPAFFEPDRRWRQIAYGGSDRRDPGRKVDVVHGD